MLKAQDFKHLQKIGGAASEPVISIRKISTTVTKSGTCQIDGCDKVKIVLTLGSAAGTTKLFLATSDTVSATFSGMTAITGITSLSGLTTSNTTHEVTIDNSGAMRKFLGAKLSNATALSYSSVHAFGMHNKTVPPRNVASGAAATGFTTSVVLTPS